MIVQGNFYSLNGKKFIVSGYRWDGSQLKIICNDVIPNDYDKEEAYFSYMNNDFIILNTKKEFATAEFHRAGFLNERCLKCSFYRTTSVADLYNGYSSDILEFIFSQDQFLSMKTFYTSFCTVRSGFCQTIRGTLEQEFPAIIHFTNCQFKTTKKLFDLDNPCEPFHNVTMINSEEAEKFIAIIKSNFTQFLEGNGAISCYKTIKLPHFILSPYQIDFLRLHTPGNTKIYFTDMLSAELICRDIKELESCYLFYCYAKDLTIENYYSYVSNGDSIMITENEQWFIASEPVKNSHYMSNYFFTSKDDLLLEKFSVVT